MGRSTVERGWVKALYSVTKTNEGVGGGVGAWKREGRVLYVLCAFSCLFAYMSELRREGLGWVSH